MCEMWVRSVKETPRQCVRHAGRSSPGLSSEVWFCGCWWAGWVPCPLWFFEVPDDWLPTFSFKEGPQARTGDTCLQADFSRWPGLPLPLGSQATSCLQLCSCGVSMTRFPFPSWYQGGGEKETSQCPCSSGVSVPVLGDGSGAHMSTLGHDAQLLRGEASTLCPAGAPAPGPHCLMSKLPFPVSPWAPKLGCSNLPSASGCWIPCMLFN